MFIYGGFIRTGGTLNNGKPWYGVQIMLAEVRESSEMPMSVRCFKGIPTDSLFSTLSHIPANSPVDVTFSMCGTDFQTHQPIFKISSVQPIKVKPNLP